MTKASAIGELIVLAGGTIEGKTRLQKSDYFLESRGVGFGFLFAYHYYGPYSEALALAVEDATALGIISVEPRRSNSGLQYYVFRPGPASTVQGDMRTTGATGKRRKILDVLNS